MSVMSCKVWNTPDSPCCSLTHHLALPFSTALPAAPRHTAMAHFAASHPGASLACSSVAFVPVCRNLKTGLGARWPPRALDRGGLS